MEKDYITQIAQQIFNKHASKYFRKSMSNASDLEIKTPSKLTKWSTIPTNIVLINLTFHILNLCHNFKPKLN